MKRGLCVIGKDFSCEDFLVNILYTGLDREHIMPYVRKSFLFIGLDVLVNGVWRQILGYDDEASSIPAKCC